MRHGPDVVAVVLAVGLVVAVDLFCAALVVQSVQGADSGVTLSDNTSHLLAAALGGVVGILGSYLGHLVHRPGGADDDPA